MLPGMQAAAEAVDTPLVFFDRDAFQELGYHAHRHEGRTMGT